MHSKPTNTYKNYLVDYALHLADSSLIMGHRLSEWTGHGPMLEQDIAITNIALDLIGQARNFYQYAAELINSENSEKKITEDGLAYLRDSFEYKNLLITELPNGDWARTIGKILFFSTMQFYVYQRLIQSSDQQFSAIAEKSFKEITYHVKWSRNWVVRLGDGTEESHVRITNAMNELWPYMDELFINATYEEALLQENIAVDVAALKQNWLEKILPVLNEATLQLPQNVFAKTGGKKGIHSEQLGYLLAEMQFMQRAYPGLEW